MTITALPTPPSRADSANFSSRADAFLGALPTFGDEANLLASDVNLKQAQAAASAVEANNSAVDSANSAAASEASAIESANSADAAAASALSALNAPGTNATSTSSLLIGTGTKTLTIQTGKAFSIGQRVVIAYTTAPTNYMQGIITSYNPGTGALVVNVESVNGSGTYADWTISLTAIAGVVSINGQSGVINDIATTNTSEIISNKKFTSCNYVENISIVGTNANAVAGTTYVITASIILNLPSTPSAGDCVSGVNVSGTRTAVIARNGKNIMSLAEDVVLDSENIRFTLVYADTARGWVFI